MWSDTWYHTIVVVVSVVVICLQFCVGQVGDSIPQRDGVVYKGTRVCTPLYHTVTFHYTDSRILRMAFIHPHKRTNLKKKPPHSI